MVNRGSQSLLRYKFIFLGGSASRAEAVSLPAGRTCHFSDLLFLPLRSTTNTLVHVAARSATAAVSESSSKFRRFNYSSQMRKDMPSLVQLFNVVVDFLIFFYYYLPQQTNTLFNMKNEVNSWNIELL